jgi:serine/threonine protein kinase
VDDYERVVAALPAYEIGSELGRGACGVVLAGRHRQLGRLVAIKQLAGTFGGDPAVRARFIAEARVLATLDHPHVVAIYDFVDYEGLCLLVMERLTGGTVWSRFHAGGFTADVSCAILLAVCAGLQHAHEHGVLHRDIKPENLMFSGEGSLKVTDLGIAKVIGGSVTLATRAGEVLGTPAYIAPEQARGDELSPATDVYAAGTVLYELLAGRLPFPADSDTLTVLYRHVHEAPPPLLEVAHAVPADLAAVTDRAVSTFPSDRYQTPEEFGVAVAACAAKTWGRGWLARTNVAVSASGPILAAALGELQPAAQSSIPTAVRATRPARALREPVAGEFLPVQMVHPELQQPISSLEGRPDDSLPLSSPPIVTPPRAAPRTASSHPLLSDDDPDLPGRAESGVPTPQSPVEPPPGVRQLDALSELTDAPQTVAPEASHDASASRFGARHVLVPLLAIVGIAALLAVGLAATRRGNSHPKGAAPTAHPPVEVSAWKVLPSAPTARQQVAATVSHGTLWVMGGLTRGDATVKVEGYDPTISTWESGPNLPLKLHHALAVVFRGEIVVMGGWVPSGGSLDGLVSNRVFALRGAHWVELPGLHHARAAGAAAVVDDKIVIAGGQANHHLVSAVEVFDGTQWTDVAPIPTPRDHLAAASDGHYYYAVGGRALSADKNLGAVERYDPLTNRWQQLPPLPTPRGGLGAAIIGTRLVTIGGESPTGVFGTVEVFDLTTNTWSSLPPMKTPRHGMAVLAAGNTIYVIDGAVAPGHTASVATTEAVNLS